MAVDPPALILARELLAARRAMAPPGSTREWLLRKAYMPLVSLLRRRQQRQRQSQQGRTVSEPPAVTVDLWRGVRQRAAELPHPPRILLLKLDHLGDFVTALPALARLRAGFPDSVITFVCGSWNRAWAIECGLIDEVVTFDFFDSSSATRGVPPGREAAFAALELGPFDLAIDLRHDVDTRQLLLKVAAGFRAGFCGPEGMDAAALDLALPAMEHISMAAGSGRPVHASLRLELLVAAVIMTWTRQPPPARCLLGPAVPLPTARPYAVLAPGAGSPIRIWSVDRLAAVGRELIHRHDLDIVLSGAPAQQADCKAIAAALPAARTHDLTGAVSLRDLPGLIRHASLYVGYDTGTTHLAASLAVPTVAVMGGIPNPDVWHAEGERVAVVTGKIACSGCYLTHAAECPFDVRCLTAITVDHVLAACEAVLAPAAVQTRVLPTA